MYKFIKRIKNNKLLIALSLFIVVVALLLVTRVTYAYTAPGDNNQNIEAKISDDIFGLSVASALKLETNDATLEVNGKNYETSTTATAILKSGNKDKEATYNYYLYFEVLNNTFNYSNEKTPEIILTITDENGEVITNVDGLIYGTFNGVSGFDVTKVNGFYAINGSTITSNSNKEYTTHEWKFTLTYLNLPFDQTSNNGSSMDVTIYMEQEERDFSKVTLESSIVFVEGAASAIKNIINSKEATFNTTATLENSVACTNDASAVIGDNGLVTVTTNSKDTICTIN